MYAAIEDPTYCPTGNQSNSDTYAVINLPDEQDEDEGEQDSGDVRAEPPPPMGPQGPTMPVFNPAAVPNRPPPANAFRPTQQQQQQASAFIPTQQQPQQQQPPANVYRPHQQQQQQPIRRQTIVVNPITPAPTRPGQRSSPTTTLPRHQHLPDNQTSEPIQLHQRQNHQGSILMPAIRAHQFLPILTPTVPTESKRFQTQHDQQLPT